MRMLFSFLVIAFAVVFALISASSLAPAQTPATGGGSAASKEDWKAVVEGNNEFAFDLLHQLGQKPGNKFFSPYSISTALGMTYAGARGNTAKEMAQTLHFTLDNEHLHPAFGELIRKIQGGTRNDNMSSPLPIACGAPRASP